MTELTRLTGKVTSGELEPSEVQEVLDEMKDIIRRLQDGTADDDLRDFDDADDDDLFDFAGPSKSMCYGPGIN